MRMMLPQTKKYAGLTLIALTLLSCERLRMEPVKNEAGEIVKLTPLWQMPLHEQGPTSNSIVDAHLVFDQKVLIATTHGPDQRALTCVDVQSGEPLWQWDDIYHPPHEKFSVRDAHIHGGTLVYLSGGRHYGIDLETGETTWRFLRDVPFHVNISGIGNQFFLQGYVRDTLSEYDFKVMFRGDVETGNLQITLFPYFSQSYVGPGQRIGDVTGTAPIVRDGDTLLAVVYQEPRFEFDWVSFLGLYNLSQGSWEYDSVRLNLPEMNGVLFHEPIVRGDRVYMNIGNQIFCRNLWTGVRVWERSFPRDLMFSGFIVEEGLVVANCEDKVLYGLDAETGVQQWKGEGAGTSSFLEGRYLNGIVYFSGGSSSRIHAVDIQTGETVWRLDPGEIEEGALDWKPDIYVVPGENGEKGRVIACTPLNAYCFEAYQ